MGEIHEFRRVIQMLLAYVGKCEVPLRLLKPTQTKHLTHNDCLDHTQVSGLQIQIDENTEISKYKEHTMTTMNRDAPPLGVARASQGATRPSCLKGV